MKKDEQFDAEKFLSNIFTQIGAKPETIGENPNKSIYKVEIEKIT